LSFGATAIPIDVRDPVLVVPEVGVREESHVLELFVQALTLSSLVDSCRVSVGVRSHVDQVIGREQFADRRSI